LINSKAEITEEKMKECAGEGKTISETVWEQLAVLPSLSIRREFRKWFGFYRRDAKKCQDKDAEYRQGKQVMYDKDEVDRLKENGTLPFRELMLGCRIDLDCGFWSPRIRQWRKGGEPKGYEKKMTLPVIDLLERAKVEKIVKPARTFEAWKKKEMMKVKVTERLCILAKGDGKTSNQVMPTKKEILERLKWVTGEEGDFDPTTMPVHLVLYFVHSGGAGMMHTDGRPQQAEFKTGLKLMVDLLRFDDSLGVIVMPGDQTLEVFPKELKVINERFATLVESTSRVSELLGKSE
jgi:hypothetical protein